MSPWPRPPRTRVGWLGVGLAIVGLLLVGRWAVVHGWAWWHWREAERVAWRDPKSAADHLRHCIDAWPDDPVTRLAMARACRRAGDVDAAARHLSAAEDIGGLTEATRFERACLKGQTGEFDGVEAVLQAATDARGPDELAALEVLVPGSLASYRMHQASEYLARWAELEPIRGDVWRQLGQAAERIRNPPAARAAYARAVECDPTDADARLALARLTLADRRPSDALPHLTGLRDAGDGRPEVRLGLARCLAELGRGDEARPLLSALVAERPEDGGAWAEWGRLELEAGRPSEAVRLLRGAVDRPPFEPAVLYHLSRALDGAGDAEAAERARERFRQAEADLARLGEVTRKAGEDSTDADSRCEAGLILRRNGHPHEGRRWLLAALAIDPRHAAARRALAGPE